MQIKKIFAAIAASAIAISAMAVSAFAAISGGYVVNSTGDWNWDVYNLTEEDLIDDIDPAKVSTVVIRVGEASHDFPVVIRFHHIELDPESYGEITLMPGETTEIDGLLFGEDFFFNLCMCTDQPVSNNVNWDVYTVGESVPEGDDTAADDTAGDDTAADDTAGDDTAADDTASDDVATSVAFSNSYEVKSSGAWWDSYELTIEELIGDVDPAKISKIVVKVEEASHTWPLKIYHNSSENDPEAESVLSEVMPGKTLEITDVRFDEFYYFSLCISTDQLISNNVTWDVYTEDESAAEGDDTAADDTAGDDTAGDDTAADGETGAGAGEGADGDKANSDTGVEGLAVVAGLAIVAAGAVVVAKKRG